MRFRWIALLVAVAVVCGVIAYVTHQPPSPPVPATRPVATRPTTASKPTTIAVVPPPRPTNLFELLRREQPAIATTQPLGVPVDLGDASRFVFDHPIFLDEAGHLWITLPDADSTESIVKTIANAKKPDPETTHLVREPVRLVFWTVNAGRNVPNVFFQQADGSVAVATAKGVLPVPNKRAFQFSRALTLVDSVAIPCDDGISVLKFADTAITEQFQPLPSSKDLLAQPQVIQGVRGLLAWSPATPARPGSGVARFLDGAWAMLDAKDWPTSIVQLTAFLDGTVQQLRQVDASKIEIASILLDTPQVDAKRVEALVEQLGDDNEVVRDKATNDLQRIGPGAWPILKKLSSEQLPEVQQRLEILLAGVKSPAIGSMTPVDGKLRVMARYANGGILLYTESGVTVPNPANEDTTTIAPAWICVQPDHSPELVPELLLDDINVGPAPLMPAQVQADSKLASSYLLPLGNDWFRSDPVVGPRRFAGNTMLRMLRPSEKKFWLPIGADRRGRWLFRQPGKETPTLLIDPTIQDLTPRLPVWTIRVKDGAVGWTKDGWPAIRRGGTWGLHEAGWVAIDADKDPLLTEAPAKPVPPTTNETSTTQSSDLGDALLTDSQGNQFSNGILSLNVTSAAHAAPTTRWDLPATATGVDPVTLIKARDGKLFLFNQPGRVLRIAAHPNAAQPFAVEATFTRNIPSGQPARIWLDPAGRICIVCDGELAVLFPDGAIPHEISVKMSNEELKANELE